MKARLHNQTYDTLKAYLLEKGVDTSKPFRCLSPSHEDRHPSMSYDAQRDRAHCFACGVTYDLVDALAMEKGVDPGTALREYTSFYREKLDVSSGEKEDYWRSRGFSNNTIARYGLSVEDGFARIPISGDYILKRSIKEKNYYNQKGVRVPLYAPEGAQGFVIVVEGAVDAISVVQAAQRVEADGIKAIALNGVANVSKLVMASSQDAFYCIALDNDEAGEKAAQRMAYLLDRRGIRHFSLNLYGKYKDANERLVQDPDGFSRALRDAWTLYQDELSKDAGLRADQEKKDPTEGALQVQEEQYAQDTYSVQYVQEEPFQSNLSYLEGIFEEETRTLKTGISALDASIGGLPRPGLTVLGAAAGVGKTSLCLQIADEAAKRGEDVLFFTCEMTRRELIFKSLSRESLQKSVKTSVPANEIKERSAEAGVCEAKALYARYADKIHMLEPRIPTASFIADCVRRHKGKTKRSPFVVIDYLQLLAADDMAARAHVTEKEAMDKVLASLRGLCREEGLAILAISSLNRASYADPFALSAYKESGSIEYTADLILSMRAQASGADANRIELRVVKNRNGKTGARAELKYYGAYGYFM